MPAHRSPYPCLVCHAAVCDAQPANIKDVVERIVGTPFDDLPSVLHGFKWTYDKVMVMAPLSPVPSPAGVYRRTPLIRCGPIMCNISLLQGDINHWVTVLDHFDSFFEERVSQRSDVQLQGDGAVQEPPFPTEACMAVLNTTCVLLENCSNKAAYNSSEVGNCSAIPTERRCEWDLQMQRGLAYAEGACTFAVGPRGLVETHITN